MKLAPQEKYESFFTLHISSRQVGIESCAKVNVGLKITGRLPNGYHSLQTIFQEITLSDTLTVEKRMTGWEFACNVNTIPLNEENLCIRAYVKLKELFPRLGGVKIHLQKKIPVSAGLGGGSSNCAGVLKAINQLYHLELSENRLEEIGFSLGADVPFFIQGGTQYAKGVGQILSHVKLPQIGAVLIVTPPISISTRWAYEHLTNRLQDKWNQGNFLPKQESYLSWDIFENDFESLVFHAYPEIGKIKQRLIEAGAIYASLSGSGSTVFGIFRDIQEAKKVSYFPQDSSDSYQTFVATPVVK